MSDQVIMHTRDLFETATLVTNTPLTLGNPGLVLSFYIHNTGTSVLFKNDYSLSQCLSRLGKTPTKDTIIDAVKQDLNELMTLTRHDAIIEVDYTETGGERGTLDMKVEYTFSISGSSASMQNSLSVDLNRMEMV